MSQAELTKLLEAAGEKVFEIGVAKNTDEVKYV